MSGKKETGKVGRGESRGSAQVGACFILHFPRRLPVPFPQDGVVKSFSRTEGLGHGFVFEMAPSLLCEMGGSSHVLAALPTVNSCLQRFQIENGLGLCAEALHQLLLVAGA